jgi:hypothetical protein
LDAIVRTTVLGGVSGVAFLAAAWGFGVPEVRDLIERVRRKIRR